MGKPKACSETSMGVKASPCERMNLDTQTQKRQHSSKIAQLNDDMVNNGFLCKLVTEAIGFSQCIGGAAERKGANKPHLRKSLTGRAGDSLLPKLNQ